MATESKYSKDELQDKIDWEGGILAAIEYGIYSTDIADPKIAKLWDEAVALYDELSPILSQLEELLN